MPPTADQFRADMEQRMRHLEMAVERIDERTEELLNLFRAGRLVATVFKWCVGVGAAVTAIWAVIKAKP